MEASKVHFVQRSDWKVQLGEVCLPVYVRKVTFVDQILLPYLKVFKAPVWNFYELIGSE